ncbi:MAG: ATP-dependent DNA helicase [Acidimicrobiia bacterium]
MTEPPGPDPQPGVAELDLAEPSEAEPAPTRPSVAEPDLAEPDLAEPSVAGPAPSGPSRVAQALGRVVAALPGGGEARAGQVEMAEAVAAAIRDQRHTAVQAGTGTGKTLAYLVPAILSGRPTVVATATRALQDQLASKDLPFLDAHLDVPFAWAVLKGRGNYVCAQRLAEVAAASAGGSQQSLDGLAADASPAELEEIVRWAAATTSGDRAEMPREPSERAWAAVSVSARECPGANRCPSGDRCFAEAARRRAAGADVVVVNLHLYGTHMASGGVVLPEHDVVVVDEAHQLEEVTSATSGLEIAPARFTDLARKLRAVIEDRRLAEAVDDAGRILARALEGHRGRRLRGELPDDLAGTLALARGRVGGAAEAARAVPTDAPEESRQRATRVLQAASALAEELDAVAEATGTDVVWVEGSPAAPVLRVAPIDVAEVLRAGLWSHAAVVLTSATLPGRLPERLGMPRAAGERLDVGSPFDYEANALLYCAAHLPDPRAAAYGPAMVDELAALIEAAGGRTLALFTSFRVMDEAAAAVRARLDLPVLSQRDLPKPRLVARFAAEPATCLFATMGFWQGIDVPGPSLSLVTIDRLPFPRRDDPLLEARRERAGADAFATIDLPRAVTLLAQGAGRLVRAASDRGVVAVLDRRLATADYRWEVVRSLPPFRRTKDPAVARALLRSLHTDADASGGDGIRSDDSDDDGIRSRVAGAPRAGAASPCRP